MPHIHEKIDYTVDVFIVHNDRVLIRKHEKYHKWLAVGGHIELDETPDRAAHREVMEEVGLTITLVPPRDVPSYSIEKYKELVPPWYMNIHPINDAHDHIGLVYFAVSASDAVVPEKPTDEWRWMDRAELEDASDIDATILFYAKQALEAANRK